MRSLLLSSIAVGAMAFAGLAFAQLAFAQSAETVPTENLQKLSGMQATGHVDGGVPAGAAER